MILKVFNTLLRRKEEFVPLNPPKVRMFVCGITPYDSPHVGHAKCYVAFDVVARYLRFKGFDVFYLQNVTDVEDRLIQRSQESGKSVQELVVDYFKEFEEAMKALGVTSVDEYAYATHFMPQIVQQVQGLIEKGFAYEAKDGVYFEIAKFSDYGKLGKMSREEVAQHRVEPSPYKRAPEDFALWKKEKPGEPAWDSPWGRGRPGWHIEDTAITISKLGPQYDLHGGGEDLIFPHHEAEIAQAEAFTGVRPFVKYWLHNGFVVVEGKKMSKSLGNFVTVRQALEKHGGPVLRFYLLLSHYRQPLNYTEKSAEEAGKELGKIQNTLDNLGFLLERQSAELSAEEKKFGEKITAYRQDFINAMDDDFDTPAAVAVVMKFVREANSLVSEDKLKNAVLIQKILSAFEEFGTVFGLEFKPQRLEATPEVAALVAEREAARVKGDWKAADALRAKIRALGWYADDTPEGPKVRKIS